VWRSGHVIVSGGQATFDVDSIVFDKDGTLIDLDSTWFGITEAWISAVAVDSGEIEHLEQALGLDNQGFLVPGGVAATGTFREIEHATRHALAIDPSTVDDRLREAREIVARAIPNLPVHPIGDVRATMARLKANGLVLCVASSDDQATIVRHLDQLQIAEFVSALIGGDGPVTPKPHPASLWYLSDQVGIATERMLMVGDSFTDLGAARRAGAAGILAVAPRRHPSPIEELADGLIGSIQEILVTG